MPVDTEEELAAIVRGARVVAVIGIKDGSDPHAPAYSIPKMLQERGIRIIPVRPALTSVLGERAYPAIGDVPERVDIVDLFRRSSAIDAHADEILALPESKRPGVVWMQTGIRNDAAAARLEAAGIQVVMDRCLGVYSARYRPRV
ncbi:MAG TPA: CoA-binding protein [Candidatus Eisenbacteria bacterium]|jgi:predicted CoA-binding protein|nr:CoA-binding protein [Candidatus Eisenbacteria bacterium]